MLRRVFKSESELHLAAEVKGTWLRPAVTAPDAAPTRRPLAWWGSLPRRVGRRRSAARLTLREFAPAHTRRAEEYRAPPVL